MELIENLGSAVLWAEFTRILKASLWNRKIVLTSADCGEETFNQPEDYDNDIICNQIDMVWKIVSDEYSKYSTIGENNFFFSLQIGEKRLRKSDLE